MYMGSDHSPQRADCLSCRTAMVQRGTACPPGGSWCSVTQEGLVEGAPLPQAQGIGPAEVSSSDYAARFIGTGGLTMPRAWDVGISGRGVGTGGGRSYTVEAFVRPGPPRPAEQTIVMGGRVPFCDGIRPKFPCLRSSSCHRNPKRLNHTRKNPQHQGPGERGACSRT